jgi:O-antigen ligase
MSTFALPRPRAAVSPYGPAFALFVLLNFVLYVRPNEVLPALYGLELYAAVILPCLLLALPLVIDGLSPRRLAAEPLVACVVGLNVIVVLSLLANGFVDQAFVIGADFFKMLLYVLLLRGLVSDTARLRAFVWWLPLFVTVNAVVSLLDFHGFITLPVTTKIKDGSFERLRGSGIFADPNDLCSLLVVGFCLALYWLTEPRGGPGRVLWLMPLGVMGFTVVETQSRGGLLALFVGLAAVARARIGWGRALAVGAVLLPLLPIVGGSRVKDLSTSSGTGQERIQLWSDALMMLRGAPLLGVGEGQFSGESGLVAHNSYLHAFAEMGLCGGLLFAGAFLFALRRLDGLCRDRRLVLDPDLRAMQPYLFGAVVGYAAAMMALSLNYVLPTYTVLILAACYLGAARAEPAPPPARLDGRFVGFVVGSGLLLVGLAAFVRLTVVR